MSQKNRKISDAKNIYVALRRCTNDNPDTFKYQCPRIIAKSERLKTNPPKILLPIFSITSADHCAWIKPTRHMPNIDDKLKKTRLILSDFQRTIVAKNDAASQSTATILTLFVISLKNSKKTPKPPKKFAIPRLKRSKFSLIETPRKIQKQSG